MKDLITSYVRDPRDPDINFKLGQSYERQGQRSAAVAYYLRCAEFTNDDLLSYECLIRIAIGFEALGNRHESVQGVLLRAVSLIPERPEAYFLLCRSYERYRRWHEAYAWASAGSLLTEDHPRLRTDVEYPGKYGFTFEKAVVSWWIGLYDQAHHLFRKLNEMNEIRPEYKAMILSNLNFLQNAPKREIKYEDWMYDRFICKFPGLEKIKRNYSLAYQDMFVLAARQGKKYGAFLEIGCGDPIHNNNTYLLEKYFHWTGISIDINKELTDKWGKWRQRSTVPIAADARTIDYSTILDGDYDYLQIDCDPPNVSLEVLHRIPFNKHRFAVITFEHDYYTGTHKEVKELSRKYLHSFGYQLVVTNISEDRYSPFEDWWIHPDMVNSEVFAQLINLNPEPKKADLYMLGKI